MFMLCSISHFIEAQTNATISRSIGLYADAGDDDAELANEENSAGVRGFDIHVITKPSDDASVVNSPMCGALLSEGAVFDSKSKSVLIMRVSSAGLECIVNEPKKVDDHTVEVVVTRQNQPDFVTQLMPSAEEEAVVEKRQFLNGRLQELFGAHVDYDAINNAFKAMVPEVEQWTVQATVFEPYLIGDVTKVLVCKAKGAVDALVVVPLEKNVPTVEQHPQTIEFK